MILSVPFRKRVGDSPENTSVTSFGLIASVEPVVARVGVNLQRRTLGRHHERTSVGTVVLGQCNGVRTIVLSCGHLTINWHNADVHGRARGHCVTGVEFLSVSVRHGHRTAAILEDVQTIVTGLSSISAATLVATRVRTSGIRTAVGVTAGVGS